MKAVVRYLRKVALVGKGEEATDGQLLGVLDPTGRGGLRGSPAKARADGLGVCRRMLRNLHDAEDAYQATFLVLVRKASTIRPQELIGSWLYGGAALATPSKTQGGHTLVLLI
jgi:hypothetical protein